MSTAELEVESFRLFVRARSQAEREPLTLEDYLCLWRASQEREETISAVEEAFEDIAQGRLRPAEAVMQDLRNRLKQA